MREKYSGADALIEAEKASIKCIDVRASGVSASGLVPSAPLALSEAAVNVIHTFLSQIIEAPARGFASTAEGLAGQFREFIAVTAKQTAEVEAARTRL